MGYNDTRFKTDIANPVFYRDDGERLLTQSVLTDGDIQAILYNLFYRCMAYNNIQFDRQSGRYYYNKPRWSHERN